VPPRTIPTNTLADRLKRLEACGLIQRDRYQEHPPRDAYRLTAKGRSLGPVLDAIADWGVANLPGTRRLHPVQGRP
jgi:DNA-binding HxlR family transcriptional regulator